MFKKIKSFLVNEEELDSEWQKILSLIFLLLAGSMSFITYVHIGTFWNTTLKFTPGFISAIIGIVIVAPLYLRNVLKWNRSVYTILSFVLILLVFSSFIELSTGGNQKNSLIYSFIGISVLLSWLGIRGVAGISWILLVAATVSSLIVNNLALGFYGFLYILFCFLGLIMHTGLNPGALFKDLKDEFSRPVISAADVAKNEISETGKMINKVTQTLA